MYDIADSKTGYLLKGDIYINQRRKRVNNPFERNFDRILGLMHDYLNKGHILYADNFFTSVKLADYLTQRNTGLVGTLRRGRGNEDGLDNSMVKDEARFYSSTNHNSLMLTIWYDTVIVKILSNCIQPTKYLNI